MRSPSGGSTATTDGCQWRPVRGSRDWGSGCLTSFLGLGQVIRGLAGWSRKGYVFRVEMLLLLYYSCCYEEQCEHRSFRRFSFAANDSLCLFVTAFAVRASRQIKSLPCVFAWLEYRGIGPFARAWNNDHTSVSRDKSRVQTTEACNVRLDTQFGAQLTNNGFQRCRFRNPRGLLRKRQVLS